jgi:small subunit ribosomal protein S3
MGQKVNPHGLRVGVIKGWDATWYANKKDFSQLLIQDYKIREFIKKKYYTFGISRITIERSQGKCTINIFTSKPGMIIGQKGAGIEQLKKELVKYAKNETINIAILEIKQPDKDATLVAESVAMQLEKRSSFRRTMKQAMGRVIRSGAKGVKIMVSGRLDGAEIARSEHYHEGSIPLQTLRADIDYGTASAHTTFGIIGVKVWVYKGEVLGTGKQNLPDNSDRDIKRPHQARPQQDRPEGRFSKPTGSDSKARTNAPRGNKLDKNKVEQVPATRVQKAAKVVDKSEKPTKTEKAEVKEPEQPVVE